MFKKIIKGSAVGLLLAVVFNGCASKQITKEELTKSHFSLPNGYRAKISQKVVQKLISKKGKTGLRMTYSNPSIYSPEEECKRGLFSDDVTCLYSGQASIVYDVPYLRKYGQRPTRETYTYRITEDGYISVY